jgi:hypothetical protein
MSMMQGPAADAALCVDRGEHGLDAIANILAVFRLPTGDAGALADQDGLVRRGAGDAWSP